MSWRPRRTENELTHPGPMAIDSADRVANGYFDGGRGLNP
jgi:hypothetical protein